MWSIIGTLISGTIIGFGGRAILPGAQDIGLPKTIGIGVLSSVIVGALLSTTSTIVAIIAGSIVAAGVLWLTIRQGWIKA